MKQTGRKGLILLLAAALLVTCLTACGSSMEKKLPGKYHNGYHALTIYSDGTYEEKGEYGTGRWTLLEGNVLKMTDFYGESHTYELEDVTSEGIVLASGRVWERR